ncbi:hypothetical protein KW805_01965 [Candidatus Pacearchaeota archaeon]|nr:hypothetical protein [Candidatus Pacearchaeota archaeon]
MIAEAGTLAGIGEISDLQKAIDSAQADTHPIIHGLLKRVAYLLYATREEGESYTATNDWNLAKAKLFKFASRNGRTEINDQTLENGLRGDMTIFAYQQSLYDRNADAFSNWMVAERFLAEMIYYTYPFRTRIVDPGHIVVR